MILFNKLKILVKNSKFGHRVVSWVFYILLRIFLKTYRISVSVSPDIKSPVQLQDGIFYFWHQHIISAILFFNKLQCGGHCVVSPSGDGRFLGFICKKLGFSVIYGSSNNSPVCFLRSAINVLQTKHQLALAGDGPRGPAKILQPGIIYLSKKTNLPIIFIDCCPAASFIFKKSWDQFKIPWPFSKVHIGISVQEIK